MVNLLSANPPLVVFVGIGNVLRRDDGTGVYIARNIRENQQKRVIHAEVSIENYIGKINSIQPDLIILIDSMFFGKNPGYCRLLSPGELVDFSTHTHNISLRRISEFFCSETWVLGIQPASVSFGEGISRKVQISADRIIAIINSDYSCF